jgi:hypothetical protein
MSNFFNNLFAWNNLLVAAVIGVVAYFLFDKNMNTALIAGAIGLVILALFTGNGTQTA